MKKVCRIPSGEWRRRYFSTKKGIPTLKKINQSINDGSIPGALIADTYIIYCDVTYEPLWDMLTPSTPKQTDNPIAQRILAEQGY